MPISLNKGQQEAFTAVTAGKNVFISGPGGVGKSYLVKTIVNYFKASGKSVLITASTGKAAALIGGVTCHRAFRIPISMPWQEKPSITEESPILAADAVLIDEISMIRLDVFEFIVKSIEIVNKRRGTQRKPIQIILFGDFAQLPPVIVDPKNGKPGEAELLSEYYGFDIRSGFAFLAPGWKRCGFTVINLTEVIRQTDKDMIAAENALRMGDWNALSYFKEHSRKTMFPEGTPFTYLCATNKEVDEKNIKALVALPGKPKTYYAQINGTVKNQDKPVPENISLKIGAYVLMAVNGDGFHNGSGATVKELNEDSVLVQINATGRNVLVSYYTWDVEDYVIGEDWKGKKTVWKEWIGSYQQLPLRLGYAMTIHRAQGQTLDNVVYAAGNIRNYGQFYVAMSRVRSMNNLYIESGLDNIEVLASPEVIEFYAAHSAKPLEKENAPEKPVSPKLPPAPQNKRKSPEKQIQPSSPKKLQEPVVTPKQTVSNKATETVACPKHIANRVWIFASTLDKRIKKGSGTSIVVPKELAGIIKRYINQIA